MSKVQHESLPAVLAGKDVLVKAKTGTGKTLGFLIPAIEILSKQKAAGKGGPILVLSPTRELAQQIQKEASSLCAFNGFTTTILVGGTNMNSEASRLRSPCDIVVATPGRMVAHLRDTRGFAESIKQTKVFVLDEADRLLDMGFSKDIEAIIGYLGKDRQNLLFSATVAPSIRDVAKKTMRSDYQIIDTVGDEVEQTHDHVPQRVMQAPLDQQLKVIVQLLEQHKAQNPTHKIIIFFPTARQTAYYASVFNNIGLNCLEIHSRKSQANRTKTSEEFR